MALDFAKIANDTKTTWTKLPPKRKLVIGGAAAATLAIIAALTLRAPTESWSVLFSGLAAEDAGKVLEQLKAQTIPYKIDGTGTIQVPSAVVHEQRIAMASSGLPRGGGVGFEVFDKQVFGTTNFVEQMNYRRALQGELQRTISSLDSVERARVHLAMRERSLFRDDDEPPSASVVVGLRAGRTLSPKQVKGIVHLVSSSIEGLRPDRITVVDETGAQLWSGDEGAQSGDAEHELERKLSRRITDLLERVVGVGHSSVVVTAELDTTRIEKTEETWDKDKAALRSESRSEEGLVDSSAGASGVAGARGNLPGAPTPTTGSTTVGGHGRLSETKNYEVSKVVSHTTTPKVRVHKLHVAILVDEIADPKNPELTVPRTQAELDRISSLTREAAGLDTERGDKLELRSAPFYVTATTKAAPEAPNLWERQPAKIKMYVMAGAAGLLILAVLATLISRRRSAKKKAVPAEMTLAQLPVSVGNYEAALRPANDNTTAPVLELSSADVHDRVQAATKADAARAARILSAWLSEGAKVAPQKSAA